MVAERVRQWWLWKVDEDDDDGGGKMRYKKIMKIND